MMDSLMRARLRTDHAFLAVLFVGLFAMAARNATDPDLWWHLKAGQYITEHRSIPRTDPFSYTRSGAPWVAHEWLTEFFLFQLEQRAGWAGLIVTFAAVVAAALFLLYLRCRCDPYIAGPLLLLAAWATAPLWGVRPQVLSFLLSSLWLLILERAGRRPKLLWWTLPLMLLWVNLHAGFALGLALSALFLAGESIERALGLRPQGSAPGLGKAALILLLDGLIVPLNPNGLRLFSYPIETLRSAAMQNYIAEWASPNFHHAEYWPFLLLVLATFSALSWSRDPERPRDLGLLVVSLFAALGSVRLIPLFVLVAVPILCQRLGNWRRRSPRHLPSRPPANLLLNGAVVVAMAAFAGTHTARVVEQQGEAEVAHFPTGAVRFLQAHPPSGPIFNHYDWGGYLIWKLYPAIRVFVDGRADLYGQPLLDQFADTYRFQGNWREPIDRWGITTVLVPPDSALAVGLRMVPGWKIAFEDNKAVILVTAAPPVQAETNATRSAIANPGPETQVPKPRSRNPVSEPSLGTQSLNPGPERSVRRCTVVTIGTQ